MLRSARVPCSLVLVATTLAAACGYSWEVGGGGAAGATTTATSTGGGGEGGATTTPGCAELASAIAKARVAAQACSYAGAQAQGECSDKVVDECGCGAFVKDGSSTQAAAFESAVADYESAGCSASCSACSPQVSGACLQNVNVLHCVP